MDTDGRISFEELKAMLDKPEVRQIFELHGLRIGDVKVFFHTLAAYTDFVSIDAFLDGVMKVKGIASSLDMQAVKLQVQLITEMLAKIATFLEIPDQHHGHSLRNFVSNSTIVSRALMQTMRAWPSGFNPDD